MTNRFQYPTLYIFYSIVCCIYLFKFFIVRNINKYNLVAQPPNLYKYERPCPKGHDTNLVKIGPQLSEKMHW